MFVVSGSMHGVYSDCFAIFFIGGIFKTFAYMYETCKTYMYVGPRSQNRFIRSNRSILTPWLVIKNCLLALCEELYPLHKLKMCIIRLVISLVCVLQQRAHS